MEGWIQENGAKGSVISLASPVARRSRMRDPVRCNKASEGFRAHAFSEEFKSSVAMTSKNGSRAISYCTISSRGSKSRVRHHQNIDSEQHAVVTKLAILRCQALRLSIRLKRDTRVGWPNQNPDG